MRSMLFLTMMFVGVIACIHLGIEYRFFPKEQAFIYAGVALFAVLVGTLSIRSMDGSLETIASFGFLGVSMFGTWIGFYTLARQRTSADNELLTEIVVLVICMTPLVLASAWNLSKCFDDEPFKIPCVLLSVNILAFSLMHYFRIASWILCPVAIIGAFIVAFGDDVRMWVYAIRTSRPRHIVCHETFDTLRDEDRMSVTLTATEYESTVFSTESSEVGSYPSVEPYNRDEDHTQNWYKYGSSLGH
jgi:hypothetical protein